MYSNNLLLEELSRRREQQSPDELDWIVAIKDIDLITDHTKMAFNSLEIKAI